MELNLGKPVLGKNPLVEHMRSQVRWRLYQACGKESVTYDEVDTAYYDALWGEMFEVNPWRR